jgi:hypothetical protein
MVGASKAGTTSLHEYLGQHPEIFMSRAKEPHYFVHDQGENNWRYYLEVFKNAGDRKIIGESSTGYLYSPESPKWIKAILGDVKIIVLLRNPAQRAFSLYAWMVREGYEDAPTFRDALEREPARFADAGFYWRCPQFPPNYYYYDSGLYFQQVRRYFETFGRENVRIYFFEDFIKEPKPVCRDVFSFLGVRTDFEPEISVHNEGRFPASIARQYWLRNHAHRSKRLQFIPSKMRQNLIQRWMGENIARGERQKPDPELLATLAGRFREDICRLQDLLNRDLSPWLKMEPPKP